MRLFVALHPPAEVLAELPSPTGREHVTLAFLGEVPGPGPLLTTLPSVAQVPAPCVRLAGAGRFRAGAVWLGVHGDLAPLHAAVQDALRRAGLPGDPAPWRAHLTIGRGGQVPDWAASYDGRAALWRRVALVHSTRSDGALVHQPLGQWRLA